MIDLAVPKMQPWVNCCHALRHQPLLNFLAEKVEPCVLIHGQRQADKGGARSVAGVQSSLPAHVKLCSPLLAWSDDDVLAHIEGERLVLPMQYGDGLLDSLECLTCPAPISAERLRFLDRHYPDAAKVARRHARTSLRTSLDFIEATYAAIQMEPA